LKGIKVWRFLHGLVALLAVLGCAHPAPVVRPAPPRPVQARPAEDPRVAEARADFDEALARQTAGDWVGALVLLRRVGAVRMTPHVRFNIAVCEEFLGRLNAARGHYLEAAEDAAQASAPDVATESKRRAEALAERIPSISVLSSNLPRGAVVSLDGVELGAAGQDRPLPVDPGAHEVEANAPGYKRFQLFFRLREGQKRPVDPALVRE
jgi:hypothetical protein